MTRGDTTSAEHGAGTATSERRRLLARIGVAGGLLGVVQGVGLDLWPAQVAPDTFSYPLTPGGAAVAQVTFAVQHLMLVAGVVALLGVAGGRLLRGGLWATLAALVGLTVMEVVAIAAVAEPLDSPLASTISALYGIPSIAAGLGLAAAGIGRLRGGTLPGPRPLLLVSGLFVFLVLTPALMGPFELARLAIAVWMLLFAWLFAASARA
jgi:hypothetical protein